MARRNKATLFPKLQRRDAAFVIEYSKDMKVSRAAEAMGISPSYAYDLLEKENVKEALDEILVMRLEDSHIDAEWLLYELVDNHILARQMGNLAVSTTALGLIAKHKNVDAMASNKVDLEVTENVELVERLNRGRQRARQIGRQIAVDIQHDDDEQEVSFL